MDKPILTGQSGLVWRCVTSVVLVGACVTSCGSNDSLGAGTSSIAQPTETAASTGVQSASIDSVSAPTPTAIVAPSTVVPATTQLVMGSADDPRLDTLKAVTVEDPCPKSDPVMAGAAMLTESSRLEPMLGQVLAYGGQHADQFGTYGLVWHSEGDASVFISFTADLDKHQAALDQIVQYPDELIVCQSALSGDLARSLAAKLTTDLAGRFSFVGVGMNGVEVVLMPGEEALADELMAQYGDAVTVTICSAASACVATPA